MNMYNPRACDALLHDCGVDITTGSPWDILFLTGEVYAGAIRANFNRELCSPGAQRYLALRCAMAILGWKRCPSQLLVARVGGATAGAALIYRTWDSARAEYAKVIEYLAVQATSRHLGIGESLVRHVISSAAPSGTTVQCWCAPESMNMIRLLRKLGFRQAGAAKIFESPGRRITWPALWVWRNKAPSPATRPT